MLSAQVSAQQDKIIELETPNDSKPASAGAVIAINGIGAKQMNGNGVANETPNGKSHGSSNGSTQHRVDLLEEISSLKVRLAVAENSARDWEAKYLTLQVFFLSNIFFLTLFCDIFI